MRDASTVEPGHIIPNPSSRIERIPTVRDRVVEILEEQLRRSIDRMSPINPGANSACRDIAVACVSALEALGRTVEQRDPLLAVAEAKDG